MTSCDDAIWQYLFFRCRHSHVISNLCIQWLGQFETVANLACWKKFLVVMTSPVPRISESKAQQASSSKVISHLKKMRSQKGKNHHLQTCCKCFIPKFFHLEHRLVSSWYEATSNTRKAVASQYHEFGGSNDDGRVRNFVFRRPFVNARVCRFGF